MSFKANDDINEISFYQDENKNDNEGNFRDSYFVDEELSTIPDRIDLELINLPMKKDFGTTERYLAKKFKAKSEMEYNSKQLNHFLRQWNKRIYNNDQPILTDNDDKIYSLIIGGKGHKDLIFVTRKNSVNYLIVPFDYETTNENINKFLIKYPELELQIIKTRLLALQADWFSCNIYCEEVKKYAEKEKHQLELRKYIDDMIAGNYRYFEGHIKLAQRLSALSEKELGSLKSKYLVENSNGKIQNIALVVKAVERKEDCKRYKEIIAKNQNKPEITEGLKKVLAFARRSLRRKKKILKKWRKFINHGKRNNLYLNKLKEITMKEKLKMQSQSLIDVNQNNVNVNKQSEI